MAHHMHPHSYIKMMAVPQGFTAQRNYGMFQLSGNAPMASSTGHITADGHVFVYDHSKNVPHHVVFVIDKFGSMSNPNIKPTLAKFTRQHNYRVGYVCEAIV